jgi:hypothetical protein
MGQFGNNALSAADRCSQIDPLQKFRVNFLKLIKSPFRYSEYAGCPIGTARRGFGNWCRRKIAGWAAEKLQKKVKGGKAQVIEDRAVGTTRHSVLAATP